MARRVSDSDRAEETVTVRMPKGTADKVRAATGQPFSTIVRWMVVQLLANHVNSGNVKEQTRETVQSEIGKVLDNEQP